MRFCITLSYFTLLAVAGLGAVASPFPVPVGVDGVGTCNGAKYCSASLFANDLVSRADTSPSTANLVKRTLTNSERLTRGLPLLPPKRRSKTDSARRAATSAVPQVTKRGILKVVGSSGNLLGYISKPSRSQVQHKYGSISNALTVTFPINTGATFTSRARITMQNSDMTGFPLLGLIVGDRYSGSNIAVGSSNYLLLGGIAAGGTAPGAVPSAVSNTQGTAYNAESDVWNINLLTGTVTAQWINVDSSSPTTKLFAQDAGLYAGGDSAAFASRHSTVSTIPYSLIFVES